MVAADEAVASEAAGQANAIKKDSGFEGKA